MKVKLTCPITIIFGNNEVVIPMGTEIEILEDVGTFSCVKHKKMQFVILPTEFEEIEE